MKFKYLTSLAVGLAGMMTSCDVTNIGPLDSLTDLNYWNTPTDLKLYANGLILNLPTSTVMGDAYTDLFCCGQLDPYLWGTFTLNNASGWDFGVIRQCNFFLDRYQTVTGDEAEINQYVGEVRFFRACQYYNLIKRFGNVPYYEHDLQTDDTEELYKTQDPRNYVLGKIIEDLQFAAQWCIQDHGQSGRPTGDAALTQLARVCLYYGTYMKYHGESESNGYGSQNLLQMAAQYSQQLMDSGKYSIVQAPNPGSTWNFPGYPLYYSNLFEQVDLTNNAEVILPRYYAENLMMTDLSDRAGGGGVSGGARIGLGLSKAFIEMYLMADGTPIYNPGSGYKGDATIFDEVEGRDPRLWQTIANKYRPRMTANTNVEGAENWAYSSTLEGSYGLTGYACVKFHSSDQVQNNNISCFTDWIIYRYAEVLLINAEANYELGTCTQTVLDNTINKLRDRVEMAHLTIDPVADVNAYDYGYPVDPLLYEIRRERAVELINEDFRMDDLKRWNAMTLLDNPLTMLGIAVTPESEAFYAQYSIEFGPGKTEVYTYNGKNYRRPYGVETIESPLRKWAPDDKRWLYPIPEAQIQLNPNLVQNPGW